MGVTSMHEVDFERDGHVARVWFNRPARKNALTVAVLHRLEAIMDEVDADPDLRVMVLRGRGSTFCSGFDLEDLQQNFLGKHALDIAVLGAKVCDRIYSARTPSVAVLEGHATAGGFEMMLACDFAIVADTAKIGDYHIRRALIGGAGPIYRVPRMIGIRKTKELLLTGKLLSGTEAHAWGLVNKVVAEADLDEAVASFVGELTDKSPLTLWITKMAIDRSLDADTQSLMVIERLAASLVMQSEDAKEGVAAFLEKREPVWTGR